MIGSRVSKSNTSPPAPRYFREKQGAIFQESSITLEKLLIHFAVKLIGKKRRMGIQISELKQASSGGCLLAEVAGGLWGISDCAVWE